MIQIGLLTTDEYDGLTAIWEASVRATHSFLAEDYIARLKPLVYSVYLHSVPVYVCRSAPGGSIEGFMGIGEDGMLEMLFVHPRSMGKGIGRAMVEYAIEVCGVWRVDVNEQNTRAYGFYRHLGFRVTGRDGTDAQGEPYPILHLRLGRPGKGDEAEHQRSIME